MFNSKNSVLEFFQLQSLTMSPTVATIIFCGLIHVLSVCVADEDDCKYWKCDGFRSDTDLDEYTNCSLSDAYWSNEDIFSCKYCEIHDVGVCWCSSKEECQETDVLIFGVAMMALSVLCAAIVWYKYVEKGRHSEMTQKALIKEKRKRNHRRSSPSTTEDTEGRLSSDCYSADHLQGVGHRINQNVLSMQQELDSVDRKYNFRCFCVWIVTVICAIAFMVGLAMLFYEL